MTNKSVNKPASKIGAEELLVAITIDFDDMPLIAYRMIRNHPWIPKPTQNLSVCQTAPKQIHRQSDWALRFH